MRILLVAALALGVSAPAFAQGDYGRNKRLDEQYERDQKERQRIEQEYNESQKRLRTQNQNSSVPNDPWRNIRPVDNARR
jgi:uncharacterized protein HemX